MHMPRQSWSQGETLAVLIWLSFLLLLIVVYALTAQSPGTIAAHHKQASQPTFSVAGLSNRFCDPGSKSAHLKTSI